MMISADLQPVWMGLGRKGGLREIHDEFFIKHEDFCIKNEDVFI